MSTAANVRIVFLGGLDFAPNRDGLTWFLGTFRDEVLAAVADFRLLVVGRGDVGALRRAIDQSPEDTPLRRMQPPDACHLGRARVQASNLRMRYS